MVEKGGEVEQWTELPTGTVTFLFTDIEGSTQLLQELGERYEAVQDEQAAIVARACADAEGVIVRIEGDGFFVVFEDPVKAVGASVSAQLALAGHHWSHGEPLRVRMGMHTGRGVLGGGDYVGIDVNRAARIADAAHGGQVLISDATRSLVEHTLPQGASLRDLGEHRFKGIRHAEHVYDVVIEGLSADFPQIRGLAKAGPSNLPLQLTSFVGREKELTELVRLTDQSRILTLTGPGGIGKTRLALAAAAECLPSFTDGATFVDLSAVRDPGLVPSEILGRLESTPPDGRPTNDRLTEQLRHTELLLVLDNFEQVVEAAPSIEELVAAAPGLKVMVTSRVALSVRGEQEYVVPPFDLPAEGAVLDELAESAAVRLFADRAASVSPGFEVTEQNAKAVAGVVARLDGLPLAIELAASRVKLLTPPEILERLHHRLALLTSGPRTLPERQRTLRAVVEWSYDLLNEEEQRLFCRLSVFSGGWTIEGAEAVCDFPELDLDPLDAMESLIDRSLIRRISSDAQPTRVSMLETIREFALEHLETDSAADLVRKRHAEFFHELAFEAEPHFTGSGQTRWLERCDREHDNIRAALRWAIESDEAELAQETAGALWRYWQQRGHIEEAIHWFDEVLAMPSGRGRTRARAKALAGAGGIRWWQSGPDARPIYEEALDIEREHGDPRGLAEALVNWGYVTGATGDFETALESFNESRDLFEQLGDEDAVARVQWAATNPAAMVGGWDEAVALGEQYVERWRRLGNWFHLGEGLLGLATGYARTGRMVEARPAAREALELAVEADFSTGIGSAIMTLAFLASWEGRYEESLRLGGAAMSIREEAGGPPTMFLEFILGDPVEEARAKLSDDVAQRVWETGQAMSQEEAVAAAREEADRS